MNSTDNPGDFTGLTTLRLIRTGENLDRSSLTQPPALKTVYIDESAERSIRSALDGSAVEVHVITE